MTKLVNNTTEPLQTVQRAEALAQSDTADSEPGRRFAVNCTVAGNVKVSFADGSTLTFPVVVGFTVFDFAVKRVWSNGTTATATFANLF